MAATNEREMRRKEGVEKEVREQESQQQWDCFTNTGPVYTVTFSA